MEAKVIKVLAFAIFCTFQFLLYWMSKVFWSIPAVRRAYFRRVIRHGVVPEA